MTGSVHHLPLLAAWVFFVGACIGSFLNVCIHRIPLGKSVIFPASQCPKCGDAIPFYLNIPVLSYIILRGRCRACGYPISLRYPLVEMLTAVLALSLFHTFGPTLSFLFWFAFGAALVTITFIDIDHQIIPDVISLPGIILCSFSWLILPGISPRETFFGLILGGGIPWALAAGYVLIRRQQGLGGGDIKLLAMIGAAQGATGVLFTLFFASISGTVFGLISGACKKEKGRLKIPFGPFLSLAALLYLFSGQAIIQWYLHLLRH